VLLPLQLHLALSDDDPQRAKDPHVHMAVLPPVTWPEKASGLARR
jgi:hypothetical protein